MYKVNVGVVGGVATALLAGCGSLDDSTDRSQEALFGNVLQTNTGAHISATANTPRCSGTLVAPNRVLTAAHCLCTTPVGGNVVFANATGSTAGEPPFPVLSFTLPPNVLHGVCPIENFDIEFSPHDIAVLTIGPSPATGALPNIAPIPVTLRRLADPTSGSPFGDQIWSVGYGANAPMSFFDPSTQCPGCGVRRSGIIPNNKIRPRIDPCDQIGEVDCWETSLWVAEPISEGNNLEVSSGDSGGPLFFNVPLAPVVGGVASFWNPNSNPNRSRWAATGSNALFLWGTLGLPFPSGTSLAAQRASAAISAIRDIKINDRAHVVNAPGSFVGAQIMANNNIEIGVEALVGPVLDRNGKVTVRDRATVGALRTYAITPTMSPFANVGFADDGEFLIFEEFSLNVPFPPGGTPLTVFGGQSVTLVPGNTRSDVHVMANGTLQLSHGVYVFNTLNTEPNSTLAIDTTAGPVWMYIVSNAHPVINFKGSMLGNAANIFVGIPFMPRVYLNNNWRGTLVAPRAFVNADMVAGATLTGSFFVESMELHQGRFLERASFNPPWIPVCQGGFVNCS